MATKKSKQSKGKKSARKSSAGKARKGHKGTAKGASKKGKVNRRLPPSPADSSTSVSEEPIIPPLYGDEGMRGW